MMKKNTLLFIVFCLLAFASEAQVETNTRFLKQAAVDFKISFDANYAKALALAKKYNWPLSISGKNGRHAKLVGVDAFDQPRYYVSTSNVTAAATTRANQLWPGGSTGLNLFGSSPNMKNKIGVWDEGAVLATHVELGTDRVTQRDNPASVADHATHTSGTMIAKGIEPIAKGMAYGALGLIAYDFLNDASEMAGEASNLVISNHSYSYLAGWNQNFDQAGRWEYWGDAGSTEDYKFGYYGTETMVLDSIAYNAPFYLIVKSAGNNRDENGPAVGQPYYRKNAQGQMVSAGNRPAGISSNNSYDIISLDCGAKNVLTVGAVSGLPNGYSRKEDVVMSSFSSWGPTDDGRIKPDIVADGVQLTSPIATSNTSYATYSGTSMAAPNATGSLFLLQEYYSKLKNSPTSFLRSATLKGLAIHTANEAGTNPGPDYQYGWGLLNVEKAAAVLTAAVPSDNAATSAHLMYENTLSQGQTFTKTVTATGKGPLTATICWTDPKGLVNEESKLNNRAKNLVNDLDIRITRNSGPARTYMPWTLDVNVPTAAAVPGDNITDNVERIDIDSTVPGQSYTITITHKGTLARGSQAYSLMVSGVGGAAYCASAPTSNTGTRIDSVVFRNIRVVNPAGNTTYTDYTNNIATVESGQASTIKVGVGSSDGTNAGKMVKVFIDYDNSGSFETSELAASSSATISNGGVFSGTITTPSSLTPGSFYRMRIVAQEAAAASELAACGSYGKGETQDFTIKVTDPANDMTVTSIVEPANGSCGYGTSQYVTVVLKNLGSVSQSNIPVSLQVANSGGTVIANITGVYPGTIASGTSVLYTFQTPVTLTAGASYTLTSTVSATNDQATANNQIRSSITLSPKTTVSGVGAICTANTAILKVNNPVTDANYFWYTSATDQNSIGVGASFTSATVPADKTFYVGREARVTAGPATKLVYPNGGYNNFIGNRVKFHTTGPVMIETARLYIGNPGSIVITAGTNYSENGDGTYNYNLLDRITLPVYATNPNPQPSPIDPSTGGPTGIAGNPTSDTGAIFPLYLYIPIAGDHFLRFECDDGGATIYRNNGITGSNTYPTGATNIFTFTGNGATDASGNNTPAFQAQFYYFMYDTKVSSLYDCPSDRVAVVASTIATPTITQVGDSLVSSATAGNQWFRNDTAINGANNQKYKPTTNGVYKVVVTDQTFGCQKTSNTINYVITAVSPTVAAREIDLKVTPNPNRGVFNVSFEVSTRANLTINLYNEAGQTMYTSSQANFSGRYSRQISIPNAATGIYLLKVQHDKKNYVVKMVVQR